MEQSLQQRENDEAREQLIRNGNQLKNQHNNRAKQKNGEEITGDVQAWSHGFVSENVVNLSNRVLTPDEIQVLSRGLNFRPTPKNIDKFQLKKDLDEFGWRIKLKYYFDKDQKSLVGKDRIKRFRNKSKWVPEITDPMLDLFLKNLEFKVLSINECGVNYSNLSYNERKALIKGSKELS